MGGSGRGGGGDLLLSPECGCVIGAGDYGALPHIESLGVTLVVEDAYRQLEIVFCDRTPGVVEGNQVCDHIRQ